VPLKSRFHDIVEGERIVFAYDVLLDHHDRHPRTQPPPQKTSARSASASETVRSCPNQRAKRDS
jgi:hypothetical protein